MIVFKFVASMLCMRLGMYGPYFDNTSILEIYQDIKPDLSEQNVKWQVMSGPILRIRKTDGTVQVVPRGIFVEVCDEDGKVACVVYQTSKGVIRVITPEDRNEVQQYKGIFKVPFCTDVVDITQTIHDSANPKSSV